MKKNKQGSALLIVLGFLSFMVISAVAFAIYMRSERLPSSALRRSIATRHLVKAALAEAISRVDDAVRDAPFPGLCATNDQGEVANEGKAKFYYFAEGSGGRQAVDVWHGRVFMPPDPQGGTQNGETRTAPVTETVSTLTLEALGYLPPDLANDVRFLARSSWSASWQQLPFDAGRFAYNVVNVSDYLDVNRIPANQPRTAEQFRHLSVAHLFDSNFDGNDAYRGDKVSSGSVENPSSGDAATFDEFTGKRVSNPHKTYASGDNFSNYENWSPIGSASPYVSMMDYNLALNAKGPNSTFTPLYYNWLANKREDKAYYISDSSEVKAAMRQPFVTESCFTNEVWNTKNANDSQRGINILDVDGQPFRGMHSLLAKKNGSTSFSQVVAGTDGNSFFRRLEDKEITGLVDIATLYDYLDHDDVPLSLALPCVERVPMVTGITPPTMRLTKIEGAGDDESKTWTLKASEWMADKNEMQVLITYPFKRKQDMGSRSFTAQAMMKIVFATPGADKAALANLVRPDKNAWDKMELRQDDKSALVFTYLSNKKSFTVPDNVTEESQAYVSGADVNNGMMSFSFADTSKNLEDIQVLQRVKEMEDTGKPDGFGGTVKEKVEKYIALSTPFKADGTPVFAVGEKMSKEVFEGSDKGGQAVAPHVFIWVRIMNNQGQTVDLVPAGVADDQVVADRQIDVFNEISELTGPTGIGERPVFRFVSSVDGTTFSYVQIEKDAFNGGDAEWDRKGVFAVDPRFNYSPAHWCDAKTDDITFDTWLQKLKNALNNFSDRAADIFMFCSNQGFLQSIGEFGFLPYLHKPKTSANFNGFTGVDNGAEFSDSIEAVLTNYEYVWKTYDPIEFYKFADEVNIGRKLRGDQLVNPHTGNLGVMLAAIANTPYDYWAAAAGIDNDVLRLHEESKDNLYSDLGNTDSPQFKTFSDAKDYTFRSSGSALLTYDQTVRIAKTIMVAMGGLNPVKDEKIHAVLKKHYSEYIPDEYQGTAYIKQFSKVDKDFRGAVAQRLRDLIRTDSVIPNRDGIQTDKGRYLKPANAWTVLWDDLWRDLAFDSVVPDDDNTFRTLLGVDLSRPLHGVDRKFLYSYWRDCFANNQQLFLIFVRAESSALGGPGEGTPSQQGGRAVALVWRDPNWSDDDGRDRDFSDLNNGEDDTNKMRPHRTRVLFYHQFD